MERLGRLCKMCEKAHVVGKAQFCGACAKERARTWNLNDQRERRAKMKAERAAKLGTSAPGVNRAAWGPELIAADRLIAAGWGDVPQPLIPACVRAKAERHTEGDYF